MDLLVTLLLVVSYSSFRIIKGDCVSSGDIEAQNQKQSARTVIPIGRNVESRKEFHAFEKILKEFGL